ncbi:unnamed protein product, partial [Staurois parvus]
LDSGHRVTRHQVIWLDSGHGSSGAGSSGSTAGIGSPGMTAGTGSSGIGLSGSTAGIGSPGMTAGIRSFGSPAGTGHLAGSGHGVTRHDSGLRVNWHDSGHWVIRHWMSGSTAGIGSGIRSWLDSGHRVIWHWIVWIVWLDSGHRVTRYDSGHWVIRHGRLTGLDTGRMVLVGK